MKRSSDHQITVLF